MYTGASINRLISKISKMLQAQSMLKVSYGLQKITLGVIGLRHMQHLLYMYTCLVIAIFAVSSSQNKDCSTRKQVNYDLQIHWFFGCCCYYLIANGDSEQRNMFPIGAVKWSLAFNWLDMCWTPLITDVGVTQRNVYFWPKEN